MCYDCKHRLGVELDMCHQVKSTRPVTAEVLVEPIVQIQIYYLFNEKLREGTWYRNSQRTKKKSCTTFLKYKINYFLRQVSQKLDLKMCKKNPIIVTHIQINLIQTLLKIIKLSRVMFDCDLLFCYFVYGMYKNPCSSISVTVY
jgi:hypothetical protein